MQQTCTMGGRVLQPVIFLGGVQRVSPSLILALGYAMSVQLA
jgi:hypothetical protein